MVDTARYLLRQAQKNFTNIVSQDENNIDMLNNKKQLASNHLQPQQQQQQAALTTQQQQQQQSQSARNALGDVGNRLCNVPSQPQMSKKDGMNALANKKLLNNDLPKTTSQQEIINHKKLEFKLLPNDIETKMDISKQDEEDLDEDEIVDEHMKSTIVIDIDENDYDNPQLVSEYVKDIYSYLNELERRFRISPTFLDNRMVTSKMRSVLIDWLIQVHLKFHLLQETLYLCVQIIDAYLQVEDVTKLQLQLVGVTAMFLASKYEEMYVPTIEDFVYMTDNAYTKADIRRMEIKILQTLGFMFGRPLSLNFLRRFSKAGQADPRQHTLSKFFMELSLHDSEFSSLDPSYLAACALCLSFKLLSGPEWNDTLVFYSTYKYDQLISGIIKLSKLAIKSLEPDYKYKAVFNKYGSSKFLRISLIPELHGNKIKEIANIQQMSP